MQIFFYEWSLSRWFIVLYKNELSPFLSPLYWPSRWLLCLTWQGTVQGIPRNKLFLWRTHLEHFYDTNLVFHLPLVTWHSLTNDHTTRTAVLASINISSVRFARVKNVRHCMSLIQEMMWMFEWDVRYFLMNQNYCSNFFFIVKHLAMWRNLTNLCVQVTLAVLPKFYLLHYLFCLLDLYYFVNLNVSLNLDFYVCVCLDRLSQCKADCCLGVDFKS